MELSGTALRKKVPSRKQTTPTVAFFVQRCFPLPLAREDSSSETLAALVFLARMSFKGVSVAGATCSLAACLPGFPACLVRTDEAGEA